MKNRISLLSACAVFFLMSCADDSPVKLDDNLAVVSSGTGPSLSVGQSQGGLSSNSVAISSAASIVYFGTQATTKNPALADARFNEWKTHYYQLPAAEVVDPAVRALWPDGAEQSARILWDDTKYTVSEGIGYAMLIAYFQEDWDMMERIYRYHKIFREPSSYLMRWKVTSYYRATPGSATDADLDVATALLLAYIRFPARTDYLTDALAIADEIYRTEIMQNGSLLIIPGNIGWKEKVPQPFNPSYFSPVAFRLFAKFDPNSARWNQVLDANYAWMVKINNQGRGLWCDWADAAGAPVDPANGSKLYTWWAVEAYRVPWRLTWDYIWFGDERAKGMLLRAAAFITTDEQNIFDNVKERYEYNAERRYGIGKQGSKGGMCAVAMVDPAYQAWLNDCVPKVSSMVIGAPANDYFNPILGVMFAQLLNGKYVKPF